MKSKFDRPFKHQSTVSNGDAMMAQSEEGISASAPELQLKAQGSSNTTTAVSERETKLPFNLKERMEDSYGQDFSNVQIYTHSHQAKNLNAKAFTKGNEVHFSPGEYRPDEKGGQQLIGHEFAHVVQQREKNIPATQNYFGQNVNTDSNLEKEADQKGNKAVEGKQLNGNNNSDAQINVAQPVTQGFFMNPMKGIQKVFKSSVKQQNKDFNFFKKKGKQLFGMAGKAMNSLTNSPIVSKITTLVNRGMSVIKSIAQNPVDFLKNLFGGISEGFKRFFGNIKQHILEGLISWLSNAMGDAGIKLPANFNMKAILGLVHQIIIKTWNTLRAKFLDQIIKKLSPIGSFAVKVGSTIINQVPKAIWAWIKRVIGLLSSYGKDMISKKSKMFNKVGGISKKMHRTATSIIGNL
jgi:hypothetical protein